MKTIIFEEIGNPISDFEIYNYVDHIFSDKGMDTYSISNRLVLDEIRARIKEGRINHEDVTVIIRKNGVNCEEFFIDKNGKFDGHISEVLQVHSNILRRLF